MYTAHTQQVLHTRNVIDTHNDALIQLARRRNTHTYHTKQECSVQLITGADSRSLPSHCMYTGRQLQVRQHFFEMAQPTPTATQMSTMRTNSRMMTIQHWRRLEHFCKGERQANMLRDFFHPVKQKDFRTTSHQRSIPP